MQINPLWTAHNNTYNEGGEGFNPHPKYIAAPVVSAAPRKYIRAAGRAYTHAEALKAAKNMAKFQRDPFLAEVAKVFEVAA